MNEKIEGAKKRWERYKYAGLVALVGAVLLLWPAGGSSKPEESEASRQETVQIAALSDLPQQMEEALSAISGVGQVKVLLTLDSDGERQLAQDTELRYSGAVSAPEDYSRTSSTVLLEGETGEESLVVKTVYPTYRGALVVCSGADSPEVRLTVTQAVASLTGLSSDRITVAKWQ